jgi:hypothetical protein
MSIETDEKVLAKAILSIRAILAKGVEINASMTDEERIELLGLAFVECCKVQFSAMRIQGEKGE